MPAEDHKSLPGLPPPGEDTMLLRTNSEEMSPDAGMAQVDIPEEEDDTRWFSFKQFWAYAGPGWLMSIAYVDPGNLESDLQAGAYTGYQLLWVLLLSTAVGLYFQILAARLGVVTGRNLAQQCRLAYPRWASRGLWVMTELAIIGSDIQEIIGSAVAFQILFGFPLWLGCLVTGIDTFTFLLLHRFGIRKLEAFFIFLIAVMLACFLWNLALEEVPLADIGQGFVPYLDQRGTTQAVAILGAVIMPHNIFLHSALVQTRKLDRHNTRQVSQANFYFGLESALALFASFLINMAVLAVFAKAFHSPECLLRAPEGVNVACVPAGASLQDVNHEEYHDGEKVYGSCTASNGEVGRCTACGLSSAGDSLSLVLGHYAKIVWAIGLLAAGQSATMTGTFAGQFVMEGFLRLRMPSWQRVALTRVIALGPAVAVALATHSFPGAEDKLDEMLNVLQSVQLPFAVLPVLHFTSDADLMGEFANGTFSTFSGWTLAVLIFIINFYLVSLNIHGLSWISIGVVAVVAVGYACFLWYLIQRDIYRALGWIRVNLTPRSPVEPLSIRKAML